MGDIISFEHETPDDATPLLREVIRRGEFAGEPEDLKEIRDRAQRQIQRLKEPVRRLKNPARYPVSWSEKMERAMSELERKFKPR